MTRPRPAAVPRARFLLVGLFALTGITFSSWLARIPTVRDLLDLSTGALGGLLLVGAVGSLLTVTVAGGVLQRLGSRTVVVASTVVMAVALGLLGTAPAVGSAELLAVGLFLNGVGVALGNVALNVESARVERALGRTVIPQFHAAFSVGAVVGSGLGALASAAGVPVWVQLPATGVLLVVWRLTSLPGVVLPPSEVERAAALPAAGARGGARTALAAWREPRTLLVGVVVLAAAFSEGTANNWLSIAVVDGFGTSEAVGAAALSLFVAAMTAVRLVGTRLLDRYGRVTVLRASGLASVAGLVLFAAAPSTTLAGAGIVLWGAGAALAVPVGIAAASDDPVRAAGRVAVVSAFASIASLVAPSVIGLAAEQVGARRALLVVVVTMLVSLAVARTVGPTVVDVEAGGHRVPTATGGTPGATAPDATTPDATTPDAVRQVAAGVAVVAGEAGMIDTGTPCVVEPPRPGARPGRASRRWSRRPRTVTHRTLRGGAR